jgi:hypothetical protein
MPRAWSIIYSRLFYYTVIFYTECLRKRVTGFKGVCYSLTWTKEVPVNICLGINACWDMDDVRVISTADVLCTSSFHSFQHNFQLLVVQRCVLCRKFLVSLEYPDKHSLFVAVIPLSHWLVLNTKAFTCSHRQKSKGLRSGDRRGQLIGPLRPSHCPPKVWFRC